MTIQIEKQSQSTKPTQTKTLGIVFFTVFLDLVGFGILIPVQPFYAQLLGAEPAVITLLGASFSLMQFLFSPVWGRLSDWVGRRPIMIMSIAVTAIGYLIFGFSKTLPMLFFARMLAGFGSANIGTAQAIIADCTPPESRAKGMGLIGAAFGLGFIFGPALGGYFVRFGITVPIFIAAGLCAANCVLALFVLPETRHLAQGKSHAHRAFSWQNLKHAARHPGVGRLLSLYFYFAVAFSMMEQVLALFVEHSWVRSTSGSPFELAEKAASMTTQLLVVVGVTATIVQGGLIGRLAKRFGEANLLVAGLSLVSLSLIVIPFTSGAESFFILILLMVPLALGSGLTSPSLSSLLSRAVDRDEQGGTLGIGQSLSALGRVIGPAVAGVFFQIRPGLPFWVGGAILCVCAALALATLERRPVTA